ncbi:hypothetical protein JXD20_03260 [Candidatus Peregrinibacteria bacterium]|nr:hypothetical protein [Candidatus Peregrinibacteria bacterium]
MRTSILALIALLTLSACNAVPPETPKPTAAPASEVTNFEECVAAGNPVMESYPRQCRHGDQTFTEDITPPALAMDQPCTREYRPVCGEIEVWCVKAPCPPVKETYSNRCMAENAGASNIIEGQCPEEGLSLGDPCVELNGIWLSDSNECEGISEENCKKIGGTYDECASACRNDPTAEICTLQCIQVCQF